MKPTTSWLTLLLAALTLLLSGCGLFGSDGAEATATPMLGRQLAPTFTPTPLTLETPPIPTAADAASITDDSPTPTPTAAGPSEQITQTTAPRLTIIGDLVNLRASPGVDYDLVGAASKEQAFDLLARNEQGDWWQVCCVNGQPGWVFGELARVENAEALPIAAEVSTLTVSTHPEDIGGTVAPSAPAETSTTSPTPTTAPPAAAPDPYASSAGFFDPNAQYQIVHFKVLGLDENNGGIRDSSAQHLIFLTVLDESGNGVDGAVVRNLVGDKSETITGAKGPGKAEITMYYEPFKLTVVSDPSGPATSQVSNQMGLAFPHLPDLVGNLGDVNYEYGACPTLEIRCEWPIQAIHFSYEITFQKVK